MKIQDATLYRTTMQLSFPFATSYGTHHDRESIIIELHDEEGRSGWGEVVAFSQPWYTEETVRTAWHIITDFLVPIILRNNISHPYDVSRLFASIKRNNMAKAGVEGAVWDLYAQQTGQSLAKALGGIRDKIEVGVVVGLDTLPNMLHQIEQYMLEGYQRFKIKIKPGNDYELLYSIRKQFPYIPLMADANSAYTLQHAAELKRLDDLGLMMIEQPLADTDFLDHAILQKELQTPICLDESIHSLEDARIALTLGSCRIINIKAGRVGGLTEAVHIHDYCQEHDIPVWCGGMIEMGISRGQNVALASLANFTIPGDISASSRHWKQDIIMPEVMLEDGMIQVPHRSGLGYEVNRKQLKQITVETIRIQ